MAKPTVAVLEERIRGNEQLHEQKHDAMTESFSAQVAASEANIIATFSVCMDNRHLPSRKVLSAWGGGGILGIGAVYRLLDEALKGAGLIGA